MPDRNLCMPGKSFETKPHLSHLISIFIIVEVEIWASQYEISTLLIALYPQPSFTFIRYSHLEFPCGIFHLFSKLLIFN